MEGVKLNQWRKAIGRKAERKGKEKYMVGEKGTGVKFVSSLE